MRYSAGHKAQTRAKILRAAGRVFRRLGYHAAGVDKVMEEAGLTAGGFYAHFGSKEALLAEALGPAAAEVEAGADPGSGLPWAEAFIDDYLSPGHRRKAEEGCPLPTLVSEVARGGDSVKESFEAIVRGLAARMEGQAGEGLAEDRALAILSLCVGGLAVARSVRDEAFGDRILAACRELAKDGLRPGE